MTTLQKQLFEVIKNPKKIKQKDTSNSDMLIELISTIEKLNIKNKILTGMK